jgi:predicted acylesterase/phospholipase RssA
MTRTSRKATGGKRRENACFEFGVVMAGAVSAGAYSAGVFDFLTEALDAYHEAREDPDWDGPTHDVRLRVQSGTSAGGITAALGAGALFRDFGHVGQGEPDRQLV